ncbi:MAG: molybdenum cofactor guanylyltransferase MobA [Lysobacteraceae bacterium]
MDESDRASLTGLVLAGGRGSRMGGLDKGLVDFRGEPLVAGIARRLAPQVGRLLVNANRNLDRYAELGFRTVPDRFPDFAGPLAGMATGLHALHAGWLLCVPCDSPFVPHDYAARMLGAARAADAEVAMATCDGRQPVFALLAHHLRDALDAALAGGERKIDRFFGRHRLVEVDFSDRPDAFLNLNRPEDHAALEGAGPPDR